MQEGSGWHGSRAIRELYLRILQISVKKLRFSASELGSMDLASGGPLLQRALTSLASENLICLSGDEIEVKDRLTLAEAGLKQGLLPDTVSGLLDWKEFEQFCHQVLERNGFAVRANLRFARDKRRYEIDLVAAKQPYLLFIDCKHWRPGRSSYRKAALRQRLRMDAAFIEVSVLRVGTTTNLLDFQRLSLIVSLADPAVHTIEGTVIVPIFRFNSFLLGLDEFWDQRMAQTIGDISVENWHNP